MSATSNSEVVSDLTDALHLAQNILSLLRNEVIALGHRAENVPDIIAAALAKAAASSPEIPDASPVEPGAWTCKVCGFRGFWRGVHCMTTAPHSRISPAEKRD